MTRALAAALTVLALTGTADAGSSRADALAALAAPDVEARRFGASALLEIGTMADVPALVHALRDPDARVRRLAESALWAVWSRSGDNAIDYILEIGIGQMRDGQLYDSVDTFSEIIHRRPDFAEAWNKRATAYYLLGDWRRSAADCDEVLRRNPQHFGALSGYGMIWLQLDEPTRALERFEQALAVNPNLDSVQQTIDALRALLIKQRRDAI
ncbi:MAG TPA: tetratricopeptide repeat protein [Methylomirabilota bacterium]|jgi:tetratricopeptide (TPR) repeat protein